MTFNYNRAAERQSKIEEGQFTTGQNTYFNTMINNFISRYKRHNVVALCGTVLRVGICPAFLLSSTFAQNTLEFVQDGSNNSYQIPIPKGPTSIPQTIKFYQNNNGAVSKGIYFHLPQRALLVTFSFDEQAYVNVPQHVTGMTFGASPGAAKNHVKHVSVFGHNYSHSDSTRSLLTGHPDGPTGQGIDAAINPGLALFLSTKPLQTIHASTADSSRYYYGKLRITFSRPVKDPIISLMGLGATTNFGGEVLGFSTELELLSPGLNLAKLSGNSQLVLDRGCTKILHKRSHINGNCDSGAACGSVLARGSDIVSLVFAVYLRPDGRRGAWNTQKVTNSGDLWYITMTLPEQ